MDISVRLAKQVENNIRGIYNKKGRLEPNLIRKILNRHVEVLGKDKVENLFVYLFTKYGTN